jgi:hypothetical protein
MFYSKQAYNNRTTMSPAFSSLSFKVKRNIDTRVFSDLSKKSTPDPYFKSLMSQQSHATKSTFTPEPILKKEETPQQKEQKEQKEQKQQKEFRSKVYGAIMRYKDKDTNEIYYALIQGRYTGKWSFPKGHSNKGEEPYDCVKREVFEETGINNLPNPISDQRIGFGHYYIFDVETKYSLNPQDCKEVMDKRWVTQYEFDELQLNVDASYFKKLLVSESG